MQSQNHNILTTDGWSIVTKKSKNRIQIENK